ncbi:antibiotic biosynthesis monooxygenase family protein [Billgrantia sp. C5P2]|uniref:antibiotic biosynthesis monooxygenase family protein n=1 Tax=Billgrantia sp. C5P2 TaxID=3436239 RepID=UPI003DA45062
MTTPDNPPTAVTQHGPYPLRTARRLLLAVRNYYANRQRDALLRDCDPRMLRDIGLRWERGKLVPINPERFASKNEAVVASRCLKLSESGVHMIAVIFEVIPKSGRRDQYLDIAASLRPLLDEIDGFISIERFESLTQPGKVLSLSFWRDEQAVAQWRQLERHRSAQTQGREIVFDDYRLRVAGVMRDYGMHKREQAPADSRERHDAP